VRTRAPQTPGAVSHGRDSAPTCTPPGMQGAVRGTRAGAGRGARGGARGAGRAGQGPHLRLSSHGHCSPVRRTEARAEMQRSDRHHLPQRAGGTPQTRARRHHTLSHTPTNPPRADRERGERPRRTAAGTRGGMDPRRDGRACVSSPPQHPRRASIIIRRAESSVLLI